LPNRFPVNHENAHGAQHYRAKSNLSESQRRGADKGKTDSLIFAPDLKQADARDLPTPRVSA
jgi:hypothetical protein